jgi:hydroxypyruvate reductase
MDAGLDIGAMNAVRKRFLRWGAGRLAVALAPARTRVLLLSDVPGDAPADIGSGPCAPDEWSARDLTAMLEDARLLEKLAPSLREYLSSVFRGLSPDTPKSGHPAFAHVSTTIVGSNALALDAALARAKELGIRAERGAFALAGEAAACGERIARTLLECAASGRTGCFAWGGETTVRLGKASVAEGTGGRCQELALAAAGVLAEGGDAAKRVTLLAAGTDGRDGPTDASGAFADASLWQHVQRAGTDPAAALARHHSHAALDAAGALFRRGPTGTNVMDVVLAVVE